MLREVAVTALTPDDFEASIGSHALEGSATNGTLTTLDLSVGDRDACQFLVVMTALPDERAAAPQVSFQNGLLKIVDKKKTWSVKVTDIRESADPAQPLMSVMK